MKNKFNYNWLVVLLPVFFLGWYFFSSNSTEPVRTLQYFGPKKIKDPREHIIRDFSFVDQYGRVVGRKDFKGKVYVAEFFFTTCGSICPVMNRHLVNVYNRFNKHPDFKILSHTVDPETDSVRVLLAYAKEHGVQDSTWLFVTGNKRDLYSMARQAYLLANSETGDPDEFVHTQQFALIDRRGHIRGQYDGTDSAEVAKMMTDIDVLLETENE